MRRLFAVVVTLLPTALAAQDWTELGPAPLLWGPFTGRCSAVAPSPTDPDKIFVAQASGGIWRTRDAGVTWTPLTDHLPTTSIGAVELDPTDDTIIYAGSGEANYAHHCFYGAGLYKSVDDGDTWTVLAEDTFAGRTFSRIAIDPTNTQELYASIMHAGGFPARRSARGHPRRDDPVGVYRSRDGGVSWERLTNGLPAVAASDLWMDPSNSDVLYAAIGDPFGDPANGLYKSVDGGDSWTQLGDAVFPSVDVGRISVAGTPADPLRLYALVTLPSDAAGGSASTNGVFRSDDGGVTWSDRSPANLQETYGWYLCVVGVSPTDPDTVFAGGVWLFRSRNGGDAWTDVTPPHVDIHGLEWDASGRLLAADDGGLHRSATLGTSWGRLVDDLRGAQIYPGLSLHPTDPDFIMAGMQDNGTHRRGDTPDNQWAFIFGGDGGYTAIHPSTPDVHWVQFQGTANLYMSTDGGANFDYRGDGINPSDRNCFLPPYTYSPTDPDVLYFGTHRIYRTTNRGASWTAISADLTGGASWSAINALVVAPSNDQVLYAGTNDGNLLTSSNGGFDWDLRLTDVAGWPRVTRAIAVDPLDDAHALLAGSQFGVAKVRRTEDRGASWSVIDWNLPDIPVNTVAIHRTGDRRALFAGSDRGVWMAWEDEMAWRRYGPSLPNVPVIDVVSDPRFGRLVAATMGRGAWSIELPEVETGNCANGEDDDFDGSVDCADDECLRDPACVSADFDSDGTDNENDCAPMDPGSRSVPAEVPLLNVAKSDRAVEVVLSWTDVTGPAGSGTLHEVASDLVSTLRSAAASGPCVARDVAGTTHVHAADVVDDGLYYLVRAVNACGPPPLESWGADSFGTPRRPCP